MPVSAVMNPAKSSDSAGKIHFAPEFHQVSHDITFLPTSRPTAVSCDPQLELTRFNKENTWLSTVRGNNAKLGMLLPIRDVCHKV